MRRQFHYKGTESTYYTWIAEIREVNGKIVWLNPTSNKWEKSHSRSYSNEQWLLDNGWQEVPPEKFIGERQVVSIDKEGWSLTKAVQFKDGQWWIHYLDGTVYSYPSDVVIDLLEHNEWKELNPEEFLVLSDVKEEQTLSSTSNGGIWVEVPNKFIARALQETAFKNGYYWGGNKISGQLIDESVTELAFHNKLCGIYYRNKKCKSFSQDNVANNIKVSLDEAVKYISTPVKQPIKIDIYTVEITASDVKVGCKTVSKSTVKKIVDAINAQSNICLDDQTPVSFKEGKINVAGRNISFEKILDISNRMNEC